MWWNKALKKKKDFFNDPHKFFEYHGDLSEIHKKNESLIEIQISGDFFFQILIIVLIPNRKSLLGADRIRCKESGTPSTNN